MTVTRDPLSDASERAPASERPATACVAGERSDTSRARRPPMRASERQRASGQQRPAWPGNAVNGHACTRAPMRASERQRASGQQRPAWPGNAVNVERARHRCERASASERAASNGLRGRGTHATRSTVRASTDASERAPASERPATACVAGERSERPAWPGNAVTSRVDPRGGHRHRFQRPHQLMPCTGPGEVQRARCREAHKPPATTQRPLSVGPSISSITCSTDTSSRSAVSR